MEQASPAGKPGEWADARGIPNSTYLARECVQRSRREPNRICTSGSTAQGQGAQSDGCIRCCNTNRISDYVGNLERFVEGFAVQRPTALAFEDREVVKLPGLMRKPCPAMDSNCVAATGPDDEASRAWSFYCPNTAAWVSLPDSGDPAGACNGMRPTRARIEFSMDPWGRLGMDIAHEPYARRYNGRWTRLAVNLVGTGIRDCALAADPMTCYSQPFVRFNMNHVGPAWVTNHDGQWRVLGVTRGQIDGAKALAVETWLDPISDSWDKPQIEAVMRNELFDRPLGGIYQLELEIPPELQLSKLENVQLMLGFNYWVKQ